MPDMTDIIWNRLIGDTPNNVFVFNTIPSASTIKPIKYMIPLVHFVFKVLFLFSFSDSLSNISFLFSF